MFNMEVALCVNLILPSTVSGVICTALLFFFYISFFTNLPHKLLIGLIIIYFFGNYCRPFPRLKPLIFSLNHSIVSLASIYLNRLNFKKLLHLYYILPETYLIKVDKNLLEWYLICLLSTEVTIVNFLEELFCAIYISLLLSKCILDPSLSLLSWHFLSSTSLVL